MHLLHFIPTLVISAYVYFMFRYLDKKTFGLSKKKAVALKLLIIVISGTIIGCLCQDLLALVAPGKVF